MLAEKYLGGHVSIGRLTVFGENAMHWGITFWTKRWGYICFRLPLRCFGHWWPLYFYVSPNATPWASTYYRGPESQERGNAAWRKEQYGHNFDAWIGKPLRKEDNHGF
jgi:hypothetical protein